MSNDLKGLEVQLADAIRCLAGHQFAMEKDPRVKALSPGLLTPIVSAIKGYVDAEIKAEAEKRGMLEGFISSVRKDHKTLSADVKELRDKITSLGESCEKAVARVEELSGKAEDLGDGWDVMAENIKGIRLSVIRLSERVKTIEG